MSSSVAAHFVSLLVTCAMSAGYAYAGVVEIMQVDGRYRLLLDGAPFDVRGVGLEGSDETEIASLAEKLAHAGGNTFRTWGTESIEAHLGAAERNDLQVLVGLDIAQQLSGFDYGDAATVRQQHTAAVRAIETYRDHPNLLGWIVGNEPNLLVDEYGAVITADPRVYDAIDAVVTHIHEHDPSHPAVVAFAFTPTLDDDVRTALARIPSLDIVAFQGYGALPAIPDVVTRLALDRPFMITEFGALGHWEMPSTDWGREIEEPSGVKADGVVARMTPAVTDDRTGKLLGAFAFLWGQKQERTPTWYGLFTKSGERTSMVDELERFWTGEWPANRAPAARAMTLDGRSAVDNIVLETATDTDARLLVVDPDGDALDTRWVLRQEVGDRSDGGHHEVEPESLPLTIRSIGQDADGPTLRFVTPDAPGEYRLFVYAADGHGGVATANVPFRVMVEHP